MTTSKNEKIRKGIAKYLFLRQQLFATNVAEDQNFQKAFNGFFRMRRRTEAYYADYYAYLQEHKRSGVAFSDALTFLYQRHGRLEMSFVSKMVALVDPTYPIWDSVVTKGHFGITAPYAKAKNRLQKGIEKYKQYCHCYDTYMKTSDAKAKIAEFEKQFPNTGITDVKKVDFILWQER